MVMVMVRGTFRLLTFVKHLFDDVCSSVFVITVITLLGAGVEELSLVLILASFFVLALIDAWDLAAARFVTALLLKLLELVDRGVSLTLRLR